VLLFLQPVGEQGVAAPCVSYAFHASCFMLYTLHDRHMYSERSYMLVNMSQISTTLAFRHSALPCQTISCTHTCNFSYTSHFLSQLFLYMQQHDTFEVWCSVTGMAVSRVWQPPVAALPSMPVAFMLYNKVLVYVYIRLLLYSNSSNLWNY